MTAPKKCKLCKKRQPVRGRKTCIRCSKQNSTRLRRLYEARAGANRCTRCGKNLRARTRFTRCKKCRGYIAETVRRSYRRKRKRR